MTKENPDLRTKNKLNTPYNTNIEYAKKANKINDHTYNYEFGNENDDDLAKFQDTNNRYEFGNFADISAKDSPLARGANIADAFSYPLAGSAGSTAHEGDFGNHNAEYALDQSDNIALQRQVNPSRTKTKYQEHLKQNYGVDTKDKE